MLNERVFFPPTSLSLSVFPIAVSKNCPFTLGEEQYIVKIVPASWRYFNWPSANKECDDIPGNCYKMWKGKKINKTRGCRHWCVFDLHLCNLPISGHPWEDRFKELQVKIYFFLKRFPTFRESKIKEAEPQREEADGTESVWSRDLVGRALLPAARKVQVSIYLENFFQKSYRNGPQVSIFPVQTHLFVLFTRSCAVSLFLIFL